MNERARRLGFVVREGLLKRGYEWCVKHASDSGCDSVGRTAHAQFRKVRLSDADSLDWTYAITGRCASFGVLTRLSLSEVSTLCDRGRLVRIRGLVVIDRHTDAQP